MFRFKDVLWFLLARVKFGALTKISMTDKEIELAMEGLFRGASKVRARKYSKKLSSNVNKELMARIAEQSWKEEMIV